VVERGPETRLAIDARGDPAHPRAKGFDQETERAVQLITETATAAAHDLVEEVRLVQRDLFAQVNAEVLERDGALVCLVQRAQARGVGGRRRGQADAVEVGHYGLVFHGHPPDGCVRRSQVRRCRRARLRGNGRHPEVVHYPPCW
jgi:hypothetical protein